MNILITGATGLIGSALQNSLTNAGHTIYKMDRSRQSTRHLIGISQKISLILMS